MQNFLSFLENPQINHFSFYEVMRDFRKGGLNPSMYDEFVKDIESLPSINKRKPYDYDISKKYQLYDISKNDYSIIMREVIKRQIEKNKKCWHPEASVKTCSLDDSGKIIISGAHSIQNNGILNRISENGHVMNYNFEKGEFSGKKLSRHIASTFYGFCNTHDVIFKPIEIEPYIESEKQNFLFAYRAFTIAAHKKEESSFLINYDNQINTDIKENKKIFDRALLNNDYSIIETEIIQFPAFYPIAASSAFYLEFDFERNPIKHSTKRIEVIFVTLFPSENKTYFLLSYLKEDKLLYEKLGFQLRERKNLKSDITMLLASHVENIFFNPIYYKEFIEKYEKNLEEIFSNAHFDCGRVDEDDNIKIDFSFTPDDYLTNKYNISFFGY